jgi:hypothetical protein
MTLEDAINASQIHAARGYTEDDQCVVSLAYYGDKLLWLTGFGGNWAKGWKPVDEAPQEEQDKLKGLDFRPTGPKPEDQIEREVIDALTEMHEDEDDFEPIGERDE